MNLAVIASDQRERGNLVTRSSTDEIATSLRLRLRSSQ